jgi:hypothetical protein
MHRKLDGVRVYTDAPTGDNHWLRRLTRAAGLRHGIVLHDVWELWGSTIGQHTRRGRLNYRDSSASLLVARAIEAAAKRAPHRHRAAADVRHLLEVHRILSHLSAPQSRMGISGKRSGARATLCDPA